jgi:F-type H+-transporting ATPase subunit delta
MQDGTVGRRYARALILSLEEGRGSDKSTDKNADKNTEEKLQKVEEELSAVAGLLDKRAGHADFRQAMLNPGFSAEQRKKVLEGIASAHGFEPVTRSFLLLLADKDRLPSLQSIARAFREEVDARVGRVRATLLTAKPLDPKALMEIVQGLEKRTGKKVVPDVELDPRVIAGVQARIGGLVFDATVRSQLDRLRAGLNTGAYQVN